MRHLRDLATGIIWLAFALLGTPIGAAARDHSACAVSTGGTADTCPPVSAIAQLAPDVRASHVFFSTGGSQLDSAAQEQLVALGVILAQQEFSQTCLRLIGHSDPSGPEDINLQLSYLRAQSVADFLTLQMGSLAPEITITGQGEMAPLTNLAKDSLAHRRVAIEARSCLALASAAVTE